MDELGGYNRLRVILFILIIIMKTTEGCLEDERVALLELKSSFHYSSYLRRQTMTFYSWGITNCCEWEGVQCSSSTGRLTHLSVKGAYTGGFYNTSILDWKMNASLFFPFQQLTTLSLQKIDFIGDSVNNQGFDGLSRLENLESLDLSFNRFMDINNILSSIGRISSLKSLSFRNNGLDFTTDDIQGLARLENLESLNLSDYNFFLDNIFSIVSGFSSLKSLSLRGEFTNRKGFDIMLSKLEKLESLDLSLSNNLADKSLLSSIKNISSLKSLYLSNTGLKSTNDIQELSKLVNLEVLDLSGNNFTNNNNSTLGLLSSVSVLSSLKTLDLSGCGLEGTIDLQELDALRNLEVLRLSSNKITKVVASKDIGAPRNLNAIFLDLITTAYPFGFGKNSNVELHSLGAYPNLKTISLCGNTFEGPLFFQEEGNLTNLEELFLDFTFLNEKAFDSLKLEGMSSLKHLSLSLQFLDGLIGAPMPRYKLGSLRFFNLKNLEYLDLSGYQLDNNILKNIGKLISLKTLILSRCRVRGILPSTEGLCSLRNLEFLDLGYNELNGTLPQCIANLTSLQNLYLSDNHFNGSISPLRSLTSLQELTFSNNLLQVPLSLEPFFNHSYLKFLNGENNHIIYDDDDDDDDDVEVHESTPKFQLERLVLSDGGNGTRINGIGFPKFLWNQHDLRELEITNIQLKGELPNWLLQNNNNNLWSLNLANTFLSGPLHLPNHSPMYLQMLDISNNDLNGIIPLEIGQSFPNLNEFQLYNNKFSGDIPHSLLNCTYLQVFDASNNHLSGRIPGWIANLSSLQMLDLSENRFFGRLPPQLGPSRIREVYLSENMLQGSLGTAFYNFFEMMTLDLSRNNLSGTIPKWIGKLSTLRYLLMSHNNLKGEIPVELCNLERLSLLDLSNNNLSGHDRFLSCIRVGTKSNRLDFRLDRSLMFPTVTSYMEQPLMFTTKSTTRPFEGSILRYISGIDLSCNNFTGKIPTQIGKLNMIQALNLSHNSFIGQIPESFSNLTQIESLDLSYNKLDGNIPSQLLGLTSLSRFNVSHNNLSGMAPNMVRQFATFDNTSYKGNPFLCGPPLTKSCSSIVPPSPNAEEEEEDDDDDDDDEGGGFMDMKAFYVSCVISYIVVLCTIGAVLYVNPYWRRRWFYMIEVGLKNCYYFIEDNVLFPLFKFRAS